MQRGDIIFVQGKGFIPSVIRFFDEGRFSHVCIALSNDEIIEAQINDIVRPKQFDKSIYNYIEVIDLGLTVTQRYDIYKACLNLIGRKYDYLQDFWYVLRKIFHLNGVNFLNNKNYLICSEFVFIVLKVAGIWDELGVEIKDSERGIDLTPNQLYDLVKYISLKQP
jgi:hypothetical protein